jgi:hypothetical protein
MRDEQTSLPTLCTPEPSLGIRIDFVHEPVPTL